MKQVNAVVMPCLNEQQILAHSCASLGFGAGRTPPANSFLVIVDNDSSDGTREVAASIKAQSPPGCVIVVSEPEKGHVPARQRGTITAQMTARERGIARTNTLILQVDADTHYSENYVNEIANASAGTKAAILFKARTDYPPHFLSAHAEYVSLCNEVDAEFEHLLSDHPADVIVDDMACAYRLSDYLAWGGHMREFDEVGDEILSETTRLFLRAKAAGCEALLIEDGLALHSTRRIAEHPAMDFATAGFPRERTWQQSWQLESKPIDSMKMLAPKVNHPLLEKAKTWRRTHVLGLFGILPLHVARTLGIASTLERELWAGKVRLPARVRDDIANRPAILLQDALKAAEKLFNP